ncbi:hypothetical protein [Rhizobium oryzicola]|uniref:Uncharacterized protein n=1 Tax=Rhizobium oryzicola TaxID=1232668 RepID=A0ABT8SV09_9HYPH|nr:hypothetical protein [Rhizobium oryzicola]MDO1582279.1 hypothetical protein [Rhizobium oryzicola]
MPDNVSAGDARFAEGLGETTAGMISASERLSVFAADPFCRTEVLDVEDRAAVEGLVLNLRQIRTELAFIVSDTERRLSNSRQQVFSLSATGERRSTRWRQWGRWSGLHQKHKVQVEMIDAELWRLSESLDAISLQQETLNQTFYRAEAELDGLFPAISGSNRHQASEVQRALARHAIFQDFLDIVREHRSQLHLASRKLQLIAQDLILLKAALQNANEPVLPDHALFRTWAERAHRGMLSAASLARRRASLG